MSFQELVTAAKGYFPNLEIKYKDQSPLMKLLGKLLFFSPSFMTSYTTTLGETIYFPNENFVKLRPISASVVLLHELVHVYDSKRVSKPVFSLSYLFPQILFPLCLLLFFFISWKIALPLSILTLAPIPAYFRAHWEKRAYLSSLYTAKLLGDRLNFDSHPAEQANDYLQHFHGPFYYFMWPFHDIDKEFENAGNAVKKNKRPYEDPVFDMLEDLVTKA